MLIGKELNRLIFQKVQILNFKAKKSNFSKRFKEKTGIWRDKRRRHGFEEEHGREKRSAEENKEKASDRGEDESETDWLNQAKHGALTETQAKEVEEVKQARFLLVLILYNTYKNLILKFQSFSNHGCA